MIEDIVRLKDDGELETPSEVREKWINFLQSAALPAWKEKPRVIS